MLLLLACHAPEPAETAPVETGREDDGVERPTTPPERTLDAPAAVAITCAEAIPVDGKTNCTATIAWPDGDVVYEGGAGVGLHGRSSAGFPKPQYAVELRDESGADAPVDLFGMGKDADWLLNGMYLDRALFRNKLAFDLFNRMGGWAPDSVYVELTLNGAFLGVYLLNERVEIDEDRIDIPEPDESGASFVVRADEQGLVSRVQYAHWAPVEPDPTVPADADRIFAFEDAILAGDGSVFDIADMDRYVDFVLLEETLKNNDGYYLSHHLYAGADGRLRFVPWDLDLTLGQPSYNDNERSDGWILYRPDIVARPAQLDVFRTRFAERWSELRSGDFADAALLERMEGYRGFLGPALDRNWETWDITAVENVGFPIYSVSTPEEEYAHVEAWLIERLAWMDANITAY